VAIIKGSPLALNNFCFQNFSSSVLQNHIHQICSSIRFTAYCCFGRYFKLPFKFAGI